MNIFKSHFRYTKSQRNGILFLVILILILQFSIVFIDFSSDKFQDGNSSEFLAFQKQIDSLKGLELEKRKPKIYPFNPNFISDFKGEKLGMSLLEIDRLHQFRKQNKYVNSAKEFQQVTKISDSLLQLISPYFKFPDWVKNKNRKVEIKTSNPVKKSNTVIEKNTDLPELKKPIDPININTATFKQVLRIPYIDYNLCKKIFDYRDEVAELQDISELKNIEGFPLDKYDRIIVYLTAK